MRIRIYSAAMLRGAVAMLCATAAQADGTVCSKKYRDSTPAERARMTAILDIVKRSLPPAPAGWRIGGDETVSIISSVCPDDEAKPWRYGFALTYNRVDGLEERDKKFREASAQANDAYAQKRPRMDAVMKKMEALSGRQVALIQKGDMAGAQKLNCDMEKLQTEYQKIANEGPSEAIIAAVGKEYAHDTTMSLSVRINTMSVHKRPGSTNITLPPGAFVAQRWVDPGSADKNDEGHGIVLFGTWRVGPARPVESAGTRGCSADGGARHHGRLSRRSDTDRADACRSQLRDPEDRLHEVTQRGRTLLACVPSSIQRLIHRLIRRG